MKIHKIISKSKDNNRMEVIAVDNNGYYKTLHLHRHGSDWKYYNVQHKDYRNILLKGSIK